MGQINNYWEQIFKEYDALEAIKENGCFQIKAKDIKRFKEPRLMTKFDHEDTLPECFHKNKLGILPLSRSDFSIGHYKIFAPLPRMGEATSLFDFPNRIQSLPPDNISSETIALSCAFLSGINEDFINDGPIEPTVGGKMGSGCFDFKIKSTISDSLEPISVNNSEIEIDAGYESEHFLSLFEAKTHIDPTFLIRQLYYPFRRYSMYVNKKIKLIYFIYSNGIFSLYEFKQVNKDIYNSLVLVQQKNYSLIIGSINRAKIQSFLNQNTVVKEPEAPFPQADDFSRVINMLELADKNLSLSKGKITDEYQFDPRQSDYYANACVYLGILNKETVEMDGKEAKVFVISDYGKMIMRLPLRERQFEFAKAILSHQVFRETYIRFMDLGAMPENGEILEIMHKCHLYKVNSEVTYFRRKSTITGWIKWIVSLFESQNICNLF
jgi:hypothetical protein